jgi:hypothetical protein
MKTFLNKYQIYFNIYFFLSIIALCAILILLFKKVNDLTGQITSPNTPISESTFLPDNLSSPTDYCGTECKKQIAQNVSSAISTLSGSTKTIIQQAPVSAPTTTKTTYIPLSGPITTTSLSWVDAVGTDVYIDLANDYGKSAKISWDANMSVVSGQIFARLYDVTHSIAVEGSEVTVADKNSLTNVGSANFTIWSGRNLYRVQIKSLNSSVVTFGSGRIKIVY